MHRQWRRAAVQSTKLHIHLHTGPCAATLGNKAFGLHQRLQESPCWHVLVTPSTSITFAAEYGLRIICDNARLFQDPYSMLDVKYLTIRQSIVRGLQHIRQLFADPVDHSMPDAQPVNDSSDINSILGPHELLRIFDCLSPSDVLGSAALVCKRWCALSPLGCGSVSSDRAISHCHSKMIARRCPAGPTSRRATSSGSRGCLLRKLLC